MSGPPGEAPVRPPEHVAGWAATGDDRVYTPEDLFEYIDGGAELYLSYGFSSVLTRRYAREREPDIVVDVFDMGSSENAFGVFSHSRETIDTTFGQGCQYAKGLLLFWKDRYYVSILSSPETEASKGAVFELAREIDSAISGRGTLPAVLGLLPEESLVKESVRYFHHYIWLNSHYYVADENILDIDDTTEAVLAKYGPRDGRWYLLVIEYPGDARAQLALTSFVEHYLPGINRSPVVQTEDSMWTGCRLVGNVVAVVFNSPTREIATDMLARVEAKFVLRESGKHQPNDR